MTSTTVYGVILNASTPSIYVEIGKVIFEGENGTITAKCDEYGGYQIQLEEGEYQVTATAKNMIRQKRSWSLQVPSNFDPQNWIGADHYLNFALLEGDVKDLIFCL